MARVYKYVVIQRAVHSRSSVGLVGVALSYNKLIYYVHTYY